MCDFNLSFSSGSQLNCLPHFSPFLVPNPFLGNHCGYLLNWMSNTFTFQTTHISALQRPAGPGYDPGEAARRVGAKLPASHPHLQGQAAQARSVHIEKEEIQGGVGFRGHGVSTSKPPAAAAAVGRWIGCTAGEQCNPGCSNTAAARAGQIAEN